MDKHAFLSYSHSDLTLIKQIAPLIEKESGINWWRELKESYETGYLKIADCYRTGNTVPKSRSKAKEYEQKARDIVTRIDQLVNRYQWNQWDSSELVDLEEVFGTVLL